MLHSWKKRYSLRLFLGSGGAAHSSGRRERLSDALLVCGNCDSALDPSGTLCAAPCEKGQRGLPSWRLYVSLEWVPGRSDVNCYLLLLIVKEMQRWGGAQEATWGAQKEREEAAGTIRFSEAREPSQWMSCILLVIGREDFAHPPEALDSRPSRALCRGVGSCFVLFV